ncbi:hypothetical protein JAO71_04075 [Olleya sp. YSTF-M6]|uniref:Uncharacterized protein n=1 Tax=Olleya sediminilitoris TaxID=2795739 RepID=A0ABS1WIL8_9FLAO|nr:hypothetical protein [Olleya sediminilitoris]MBL7558974.1 hypothetical protein [Olleya sediminilitoris]
MAELIEDRDFEKDFKLKDNRIITLRLEDDLTEISFWEGGNQLGSPYNDVFSFDELEDYSEPTYRLSRMYCPVKKNGLGREAVRMFLDYSDAKIVTRPPNTGELSDGSHLTEDAPDFVAKMQKEGLIENWDDLEDDY